MNEHQRISPLCAVCGSANAAAHRNHGTHDFVAAAPATTYSGTADSNGTAYCVNCGQTLAAHLRALWCPRS